MPIKRVLIVDDQRDIRQLLREAIRALGLELDLVDVPSGEEAMLVITRQRFTLLVTDVRLAGMSGLELVQTLRKRNPGVKVILVTGLTDSEIRQQVTQAGVEAFFFKPVDILEFQNAVRRCLDVGESEPAHPPADTSARQPADHLERLRADIRAECVMLVDPAGSVLRRAGGVPAAVDGGRLVAATLAAHKANAALAKQLGEEPPDNTLVSKGKAHQVHLLGAGEKLYLFTLTRGDTDPARVTSLMMRLAADLQAQPIDLSPVVPAEAAPAPLDLPAEAEEADLGAMDLSELDAVFQQVEEKKVGTQELNDFWDELAEQETASGSPDEGAITYEQARRLGLAPEGGESE